MVSNAGCQFVWQDFNRSLKEALSQIIKAHKREALCCNMRIQVEIKVREFLHLKKHWFNFCEQKIFSKFESKYGSPYKVLKVVNNNFVLDIQGEETNIIMDQFRVCKFREDSLAAEVRGISQTPWSNYHFSPFSSQHNVYFKSYKITIVIETKSLDSSILENFDLFVHCTLSVFCVCNFQNSTLNFMKFYVVQLILF